MGLDPTTVVLFGATGDLARRKLLPGLLHLFETGLLRDIQIVGTSLDEHTTDSFVGLRRAGCARVRRPRRRAERDLAAWPEFAKLLRWAPGAEGAEGLRRAVAEAEAELERTGEPAALPERAAEGGAPVVQTLRDADLAANSRIVLEKPFGVDLASSRELNRRLHEVFDEEQIFRIDHFLGKEAAQNILAFRFANGLFEPIWHRHHIDHVQIDVPEELGLEQRASFYESTGAFRDMVVTHLFQVLAFTAMEPPTALEPDAINEEKNKVFRSMLPIDPADVVRGQYDGYRDIDGVAARLGDRDVHRPQVLRRQLALGGRAVLPAHREADGRGCADHLDRVQGAAAVDVPRCAPASATTGPTTSPSTSPTRPGCRFPSTASDPARA